MEQQHDIKIEFDSIKSGLIVIEEMTKSDEERSVIKNINSKMSVQAFPTADLSLNVTPKYPNLITIKSGDRVKFYVKERGIDKSYQKLFAGFILSVKVKSQKENFELQIESTSEFYKLQKINLNINDFTTTTGLREVLNQIVVLSGIKGEISVDDNIGNVYELQHIRNFPALALINSICYELDLAYDITQGDLMRFSNRKDMLHKMFNSTPIELGNDKILSSEFEQ
jgi:hypothetical protein